jgi:hypothetical protein
MITDDNKNYHPEDRNLMQDLQNQLQPENFNTKDNQLLNQDTQEEDETNNPEENFDENYSESENFATD